MYKPNEWDLNLDLSDAKAHACGLLMVYVLKLVLLINLKLKLQAILEGGWC